MSDNPRDTQFQGFAKVLREKLMKTNAVDIVDGGRFWQEEEIAELDLLFAQSGYDLVAHTVGYSLEYLHECGKEISGSMNSRITPSIPDMTELPKEQEPEKNEALDHVEECLDSLSTGIMVGLHPEEAALGTYYLESQKRVVESVKEEFKRLSDAIHALRKKEGN